MVNLKVGVGRRDGSEGKQVWLRLRIAMKGQRRVRRLKLKRAHSALVLMLEAPPELNMKQSGCVGRLGPLGCVWRLCNRVHSLESHQCSTHAHNDLT